MREKFDSRTDLRQQAEFVKTEAQSGKETLAA